MESTQTDLESQLDSFDAAARRSALETLAARLSSGAIEAVPESRFLNLHGHTFFSFNGYGYSPCTLAWKARLAGLYAVGIVDFDVLDAVDEFLWAARLLGLRHCAGIETRIFLPEFETREINSPGEPGIAYHMGVGFSSGTSPDAAFLASLKDTAQARNRDVVARVNAHLAEIALDFDRDVLPLTPNGNPTERHLCRAYDEAGQRAFANREERVRYWASKLGLDAGAVSKTIDDAPNFQGVIRSKLMKSGGPGYVKPDPKSFPLLKRFNAFVLASGAIPTCAWLDGTTPGEQAMEELLRIQMDAGVTALNIIPDRNWNIKDPAQKAVKVKNLDDVIALAKRLSLPVFVGTEMNAHGQRFVDDFSAPELARHMDTFVEGAHIAFAHTALQASWGMGYCSAWSTKSFASASERYHFFARVGSVLPPGATIPEAAVTDTMTPDAVFAAVTRMAGS